MLNLGQVESVIHSGATCSQIDLHQVAIRRPDCCNSICHNGWLTVDEEANALTRTCPIQFRCISIVAIDCQQAIPSMFPNHDLPKRATIFSYRGDHCAYRQWLTIVSAVGTVDVDPLVGGGDATCQLWAVNRILLS